MNCEQRSLSVTKEKYLFCNKVDLYFDYLYFNDFILISVFEFIHLTVAVELTSLQPCGCKYSLLKSANACIFSTVNGKQIFLSIASPITKFGPSRKPKTLYMTPKVMFCELHVLRS